MIKKSKIVSLIVKYNKTQDYFKASCAINQNENPSILCQRGMQEKSHAGSAIFIESSRSPLALGYASIVSLFLICC